MNEAEFYKRFDHFIERMDGRLERVDRHIVRADEELRLSREAHADMRHFTRELTRRNEIVLHELTGAIGDMRADIRAHTQAIFAVLDRLN